MKGEGRVYRRDRIWWVAYYQDGREQRESSGSRERRVAVKLLRRRVGEVAADTASEVSGSRRPRKRAVTMLELFDLLEQHYVLNNRNSRSNFTHLKRLRKRFASYTVATCTSVAINNYMAAMQRAGRSAPAINREIGALRSALRLGYRLDLVDRVPAINRLPEYGVRNEFFTRAEIDGLLPCLPEYLRDLVLFGFLIGWRKGEITGLRWANVSRAEAVIRLDPEQNKGRTVRVLALQGEVAALIERRWSARKAGQTLAQHVFHYRGRPFSDFRRTWLKACGKAGLGHRLFHSLRRSAARNMSLQGIPEKVIMAIMGHKTRVMFDRYNIVTEADQREYAKRLFGP